MIQITDEISVHSGMQMREWYNQENGKDVKKEDVIISCYQKS